MGFAEAREGMQDAIFARLGEDALWTDQPDPVRVRWLEQDEVGSFGGGSQLILRGLTLKVRRSEVERPKVDDIAELVKSGRKFRVTSDPTLNRKAAWECPVEEVT